MTNNSMKIGNLLDDASRLQGIVEAPGIYKVFVCGEDRDKVEFVMPDKAYPKPLRARYEKRLIRLGKTGEEYVKDLQNAYHANVMQDEAQKVRNHVIYIGKSDNLRRRIRDFGQMPFGGKAHMGGSDIWLINNYSNLLWIEWFAFDSSHVCYDNEAEWKKAEIADFKKRHYGNRPVANMV